METRFGKFITGKYFPKIFWTFYILLTLFLAAKTDWAFRILAGRTLGIPFALILLAAAVVFYGQKIARRLRGHAVKKALGFLTCLLIYDLLLTVLWTLLCLFLPLAEQAQAAGVIVCMAAAVLMVLLGFLHARSVKTTACTIALGAGRRTGRGNKTYRIALLSDIHLGAFVDARHAERIVQKIQEISPDMVLISGDIIDVDNAVLQEEKEMQETGAVFSRIAAPDGVYAVLGNHDPQADNPAFLRFLDLCHFTLLHNEVRAFPDFTLIGRTNGTHNLRSTLSELMKQASPARPVIVLDHDPQGIREAAAAGAGLVLCGHTHRGQFFPVTWFTKWANGKHYFYGHETFGQTQAFISSGAGFFQLPVRIGTSNEVVDLHLLL